MNTQQIVQELTAQRDRLQRAIDVLTENEVTVTARPARGSGGSRFSRRYSTGRTGKDVRRLWREKTMPEPSNRATLQKWPMPGMRPRVSAPTHSGK
jgi:hypothetical protein